MKHMKQTLYDWMWTSVPKIFTVCPFSPIYLHFIFSSWHINFFYCIFSTICPFKEKFVDVWSEWEKVLSGYIALFQAIQSYSKSNINEENYHSWNIWYNFVYSSKKFEKMF